MNKERFEETGKYDLAMDIWGAENLGTYGEPGYIWGTWVHMGNLGTYGEPGYLWGTWVHMGNLGTYGEPGYIWGAENLGVV